MSHAISCDVQRYPLNLTLFFTQFFIEVLYRLDFDGKWFLIRYRLYGIVFHADSEYDVHFDKRSTFFSQKLNIRPHFLTIVPLAWEKRVFSVKKEY